MTAGELTLICIEEDIPCPTAVNVTVPSLLPIEPAGKYSFPLVTVILLASIICVSDDVSITGLLRPISAGSIVYA